MVLVLLQWKLAYCFFSSGVAKACIAVRESEGSVSESFLYVTHIKEGSALIAASFAAASARLLPRPGVSNLFYTAGRLRFGKNLADRGGGGGLDGVYSFQLLSAHVEVDSSLVSERICDVNAALENSFTYCMTAVKTFTGITIAQSLHVDFVISIGSPSWFKTEMFPV